MLPGHATFRNMRRYSSSHEQTFARWYDRPFDGVSLNKAAITQGIPPAHAQALALDASFLPKRVKQTYGLDRLWNGCHGRAEKGLALSTVAWIDITGNCAYALSVEQTLPSEELSGPDATRIDASSAQCTRLVMAHDLRPLRYLLADGGSSQNLQVVVVGHTRANRSVALCSTDVTLDALTLYRSYKARFQIEFLLRDSKQFTGLMDCQARSKAKLHFHFNARLTAASFATLAGRQHDPYGNHAFSMANLQRRAFNQHLLDHICAHLAQGLS